MIAAGEVGPADRPGEQEITAEHGPGVFGGRQPERHRARGVPGRVVHDHLDPGQIEHRAVGQFPYVVGLGEGDPAEQLLSGPQREASAGVGEQRPVGRVDEGRYVPGAAYRGHGPDVIHVAVREQHGGGLQPVPLDNLVDALFSVLARVDNQALLPRAGRDQVAVGGERAGREPGDQHGLPPLARRWR